MVYCFPGSKLKILFYGPFIKKLPGKEPQAQSHPPCPRWGVVRLAVLRGMLWGCFLLHWKKRWMFLTVAGYRNYAVLSGLSAERRRQGRRCEKFSRVGRILVFRDS